MFQETRKRSANRTYKTPCQKTNDVIEKMKEIEVAQENQNIEGVVDAFEDVMPVERPGRLRLSGRGVTKRNLKGQEIDNSIIVSSEVAPSLRNVKGGKLQKDVDDQIEACKLMQAQLQEEKETLFKEREAHKVEVQAQMCEVRKMSDKLKSQLQEIADMKKEVESQRDNMVVDVVARAFLQLSKVVPNLNSDSLKEAIGSSVSGNRRTMLGDG